MRICSLDIIESLKEHGQDKIPDHKRKVRIGTFRSDQPLCAPLGQTALKNVNDPFDLVGVFVLSMADVRLFSGWYKVNQVLYP